jgi:hypothetical protein
MVTLTAFVAVPVLCWVLLARTAQVGALVAAVLAVCAAGALGVLAGWLQTRARVELTLAYIPVMVLVIVAGARAERRRTGSGRSRWARRRTLVGTVLLGVYGVLVFPLVCLFCFMIVDEPFVPSSAEVLPPPPGVRVVNDDERGCGSGTCSRRLVLGSTIGLSAEEIARQVRDGLTTSHGWHMDTQGYACRPHGWLVDRSELCVSLNIVDGRVRMELEGARVYSFEAQFGK